MLTPNASAASVAVKYRVIHRFTLRLTILVNMNSGPVWSPSQVHFGVRYLKQGALLSCNL